MKLFQLVFDIFNPVAYQQMAAKLPQIGRTEGKKRKWAKIGADRATRAAGSCATNCPTRNFPSLNAVQDSAVSNLCLCDPGAG